MSLSVRRLLGALAATLIALAGAAAPSYALTASELRAQLSGTHKAVGSSAGALVVDLETGRTLFERRAAKSLVPASNEKLFLTAAALKRFGPGARLPTRVFLPSGGRVGSDGVVQALYLVGGGDPALDDRALRTLAADVRRAGVRRVRTGIRADESRFDRRRGSYDTRYRPDRWLGGWLGALTWAHGRPDPKAGPALEAAERFHSFLKQRGVRFGRSPEVRSLPSAKASAATEPVATVLSPTMEALAATTNQPSDNFYAEMLLKGLGAEYGRGGTTSDGVAVMRSTLKSLGALPTRNVDGSGLSRANKASARQIVALLRRMLDQPDRLRAAWMDSLAVVGRSGTLSRRMRGTSAAGRCRGKTGTLRGVSALSGYCTTAGGRLVAFSFLENDVNFSRAKQLEDRMVPRIARYSAPASARPDDDRPVDGEPASPAPAAPEPTSGGPGGAAAAP